MSHTPGPWFASGDLIVGGCYIPSNPKAKAGHYEIAKVISQEKPGLYPWMPDYPTYEANSRLIEAAPDLLAALVDLVNHVESMRLQWESDGEPRDTKLHGLAVCLNNRSGDLIRAAIAKATGSEAAHGS